MRITETILVVLLAAAGALSPARGASHSPYDPCPPAATIRSVAGVDRVVDGAYAAIERVDPHRNDGQGRETPVTRKTTLIREVIQLDRTSNDALAFRRLASRSCGAAIARASWAVVADFPLAPMATTSQVAFFLVYTTHGWKLYGSALDHH